MRRVLLVGVALVGLGVGALPLAVPTLAARHGVTVGHAGWCAEGLCLAELVRGPVHVDRAVLRWDRSVDLEGARAAAGELGGAEGADAGDVAAAVPSLVGEVRVRDLQVEGTPLPPLEGTVWPTRRLRGEGVEVDGDVVRARVPTDWGEVEAEVRPDGDALAVEATCADCTWSDPALGPAPLRAAVRARLRVEERRRFRGTVRVGDVTVEVEGERVGTGAKGHFRLPATPLADVYTILGPVVPEARRARIDGTLEGEGTFDLPDGRLEFTPRVTGFAVDGVLPPGYDLGPFQRMTRDATGNPGIGTFGEGSADWVGRGGLGEWLPRAVIAAEDGRFRAHPGYDLEGMLAAAADNRDRGEVWRGGSTLTQQLAKNLFLDGTRSYARKARELLYAVEMERELGKQRILELYLNVVEWGPGIYGARRAADVYFLKSPAGLAPEEAAWLASILPSPRSAWTDQYLRDRPNLTRVGQILDNMPDLDPDARAAARARRVRFVPPGR